MPLAARTVAIAIVVGLAYFFAAQLGFRAAFLAEQVTTVWAPTGIALAALLLWGITLWPAIWLAAFAANALTQVPLWVAVGIATGNTLEAVAAAWVLSRIHGFDPVFRRTRDVLAFIAIAVFASPFLSASIGVLMLCVGGVTPWERYVELWREWWSGDALGALLVGPAILTSVRAPRQGFRRRLETLALLALTVAATAVVSGRLLPISIGEPHPAFIIFPFVIFAAVRLGQPATSLVILGAAAVNVWHTMSGYLPLGEAAVHDHLLIGHAFMGVLAGSGLLLAAATTERRLLEQRRGAAYAVGNAIAASSSLEDAAPRILGALCSSLGWQAGGFWIVDPALDRLRCVAGWAQNPDKASTFLSTTKDMTITSGSGLPGRVWASGAPSWIDDVVADPGFPRADAARQSGLHGAFAFPVRHSQEIVGVVECFSESIAAVDHDLLATMAAIGYQLGDFLSRKQIETAVSDQQSRTRAILESALDAIISMDHRGRITEFNGAAERMFGHPREQAIGQELASLIIPNALRNGHRTGLAAYLHTGHGPFIDRRVETTAVRSDGSEFPVEVSITRVPTVPPLFTGFVRDMTDRDNAERERRALLEAELSARREAEAANRAKDEFLATLSHELRTPLNAIVGWTRMLLDGMLDEPSVRRALTIIDRNAHAQAQLVTDLLDVSRIIIGKLALNLCPIDLGSVIGAALDTVRPAADAKRIRITSTLGTTRLTSGDFQRLQQVVWNLLSNAIKFTPEGGVVEVKLTEADTGNLRLTVTDSGMGIDPAFLPHVFDRFRQADGSSTRQHGGLGLGLAIVRHLVELHGGTVAAESVGIGKGAALIVELPRLADGAATPVIPGTAAGERPSREIRPLAGCQIVVVEDDEDARHLLVTLLTSAGATVRDVSSVDAALTILRDQRADVVLIDAGLPGKDGYALARELRAGDSAQSQTRIAAVTAYARQEDSESLLGAGFDAHIAKPVDVRLVISTVLRLWEARSASAHAPIDSPNRGG